jgi:hypothetical protein
MKNLTKKIAFTLLGLAMAVPVAAVDGPLWFIEFQYNAPGNDNFNVNGEHIQFKNTSGHRLHINNWNLIDNDKHNYYFPNVTLKKNQTITVYSGKGEDDLIGKHKKVYMNRHYAIWNNDFDVLSIYNRGGGLVMRYAYGL